MQITDDKINITPPNPLFIKEGENLITGKEKLQGIVAVNKPKGRSSHWVVNQVRRLTGIKKVGHAGTLDPLASGVLVVAIGREFTKKINFELKKEKEYLAAIKLGEFSTTDDEEGEKITPSNSPFGKGGEAASAALPNYQTIQNTLNTFIGEIWQTPPIYSAVKINGRPAYLKARKGQEVKLEPRKRFIKEIELLEYTYPLLKIRVVTGPGVYIRTLARNIGEKLQTGAYLADLVRMRVGEFKLENAIELDNHKSDSG